MIAVLSRITRSLRRRRERSGVSACAPIEQDPSLAVPFGFAAVGAERPSIGVVLHLFHLDQGAEFAQVLRAALPEATLMISTGAGEKLAAAQQCFAGWPADRIDIRAVENRGRDIAPKLVTFAPRYGEFDLLLFLHSKVSDHSSAGQGWRELLIDGLCGSRAVVDSILTVFAAEPRTGMVFTQHHEPIRDYVGWEFNFPAAQRLATRMGLRLRRRCRMDFPAGSMFWARPQALRPIFELGWSYSDFPGEDENWPTMLAHAVERLFALAAELAGYRWYKVAAPAHYSQQEWFAHPADLAELTAWLDAHAPNLRETMLA